MHNPWLSIHFIALPRKAKCLHHPSFIPYWGICTRSWGSPALQDTLSRDGKYIKNPERSQLLGSLLPAQHCPHQLCCPAPQTSHSQGTLLREQLGSPPPFAMSWRRSSVPWAWAMLMNNGNSSSVTEIQIFRETWTTATWRNYFS